MSESAMRNCFCRHSSADDHRQPHIGGAVRPNFNSTFTKDYVYLSKTGPPSTHEKLPGSRTEQNIYAAGGGSGPTSPLLPDRIRGEKEKGGPPAADPKSDKHNITEWNGHPHTVLQQLHSNHYPLLKALPRGHPFPRQLLSHAPRHPVCPKHPRESCAYPHPQDCRTPSRLPNDAP